MNRRSGRPRWQPALIALAGLVLYIGLSSRCSSPQETDYDGLPPPEKPAPT